MLRVDGRAFESADAAAGGSADMLCSTEVAAPPGVLASATIDTIASTRALTASAPSPPPAGKAAGELSACTPLESSELAASVPASASAATLSSAVSILPDVVFAAVISSLGKSAGAVAAAAEEATVRAASPEFPSVAEG